VNHAYETEAERDEAEAQRDDARDHDPRMLRLEGGERADVLEAGAIGVLDAPGDQPRHRKEDGSRDRTAAQNAPEIVRRRGTVTEPHDGDARTPRANPHR
jgi:hypothetical protein